MKIFERIEKPKIVFATFILIEIAVMFFDLSLAAGIFIFLFGMVSIYAKKAIPLVFWMIFVLATADILSFLFSNEYLSDLLSEWVYSFLVLAVWMVWVRRKRLICENGHEGKN